MRFTKAEIAEAHGLVHRKLDWLPYYASADEIIAALRQLADKLQAEVIRLRASEAK